MEHGHGNNSKFAEGLIQALQNKGLLLASPCTQTQPSYPYPYPYPVLACGQGIGGQDVWMDMVLENARQLLLQQGHLVPFPEEIGCAKWRDDIHDRMQRLKLKYTPPLKSLHNKLWSWLCSPFYYGPEPEDLTKLRLMLKDCTVRILDFLEFLDLPKNRLRPHYRHTLDKCELAMAFICTSLATLPSRPSLNDDDMFQFEESLASICASLLPNSSNPY